MEEKLCVAKYMYTIPNISQTRVPLKDLCLIPLALSLPDTCSVAKTLSPDIEQSQDHLVLNFVLYCLTLIYSRLISILPPRYVNTRESSVEYDR